MCSCCATLSASKKFTKPSSPVFTGCFEKTRFCALVLRAQTSSSASLQILGQLDNETRRVWLAGVPPATLFDNLVLIMHFFLGYSSSGVIFVPFYPTFRPSDFKVINLLPSLLSFHAINPKTCVIFGLFIA